MIIKDGEKTMQLEELARKICNSYTAEACDKCPALDYCYDGHNGMADWLQEVIGNE